MKFLPGYTDLFLSPMSGATRVSGLAQLQSQYLWIGNDLNIATPQATITIDNLPNLGMSTLKVTDPASTIEVPLPDIEITAGKIWRGTTENRPEESDGLTVVEADLFTINARFALGKFVLNSGTPYLRRLMPMAQYLEDLTPGLLKTKADRSGAIERAIPTVDYVDLIQNAYAVRNHLPIIIPANPAVDPVIGAKALTQSKIVVDSLDANNDSITQGLGHLRVNDYFSGKRGLFYNFGGGDTFVGLQAPTVIPNNFTMILPNTAGQANYVLVDTGADGAGNRVLGFRESLLEQNLPNLTQLHVWQGNAAGRPVATILDYVPRPEYNARVAALQGEIAGLQTELGALALEVEEIGFVAFAGTAMSIVDFVGLLFTDSKSQEQEINNISNKTEQINQQITNLTQVIENNETTQNNYLINNNTQLTNYIDARTTSLINDYFESPNSSLPMQFNTYIEDKTEQAVYSYLNDPLVSFVPQKIQLAPDHILIGNSIGDASQVPLDSFNFATKDDIITILGSLVLPIWTTATRPANPKNGAIGFNVSIN